MTLMNSGQTHSGMEKLTKGLQDFGGSVTFDFDDRHYRVHSNSSELLKSLCDYFEGYEHHGDICDSNIYLWQDTVFQSDIEWQNWQGEASKTRLKEQYLDVSDGRWIHKIKTGMVLFQHLTAPLAIGPCHENLSQTINFIINQHINYLQQNGGLICHAACVQVGQTGIAIAAHSGGGKSTTMLKLMDVADSQFVSNDRLFLFHSEKTTKDEANAPIIARGVPKQPRVNPGTLLNNARLNNILPTARKTALQSLSTESLWQQEEKYDVMVTEVYGPNKVTHHTDLHHVILLNWQPGGSEAVAVTQVDLNERTELMSAIAKSPGAFYQSKEGHFLASAKIPKDALYLSAMAKLQVWEVTGGADFEQLTMLLIEKLSLNTDS